MTCSTIWSILKFDQYYSLRLLQTTSIVLMKTAASLDKKVTKLEDVTKNDDTNTKRTRWAKKRRRTNIERRTYEEILRYYESLNGLTHCRKLENIGSHSLSLEKARERMWVFQYIDIGTIWEVKRQTITAFAACRHHHKEFETLNIERRRRHNRRNALKHIEKQTVKIGNTQHT